MYVKLKKIRNERGMTTSQVSSLVGISKAFYCQLENMKRRLSYDTAIKIANVFDVKPDELFYNDTLEKISCKEDKNFED